MTWIARRQRVLLIAVPDATPLRTSDHLRWWLRMLVGYAAAVVVLAVAMVVWVGVTRIADYWHFQHDVIAGWLIGSGCAYLAVATIHPPLPSSLAHGIDGWEGRRHLESRWQGINSCMGRQTNYIYPSCIYILYFHPSHLPFTPNSSLPLRIIAVTKSMMLVWPSCFELMAHLAVTPLQIPLHDAPPPLTLLSAHSAPHGHARDRGDCIPV